MQWVKAGIVLSMAAIVLAQNYRDTDAGKKRNDYDQTQESGYGSDKGQQGRQQSVRGGRYYYGGIYRGTCYNDGLYYMDDNRFVICSNGNAYMQPCAPGTRNSGQHRYSPGYYYGYSDFCDINLVDSGYGPHNHVFPGYPRYAEARPSYQPSGYGDRDRASGYGDRERASGYGDRDRASGYGDRDTTHSNTNTKNNNNNYRPSGYGGDTYRPTEGYDNIYEVRGYGSQDTSNKAPAYPSAGSTYRQPDVHSAPSSDKNEYKPEPSPYKPKN